MEPILTTLTKNAHIKLDSKSVNFLFPKLDFNQKDKSNCYVFNELHALNSIILIIIFELKHAKKRTMITNKKTLVKTTFARVFLFKLFYKY